MKKILIFLLICDFCKAQLPSAIFDGNSKIVGNGLILWLDAAQLRSYSSGISFDDLSISQANSILQNGASFNSANGGSILFDGVNDYVSNLFSSFNLTTAVTLDCWVKTSSTGVQIVAGKGFNGSTNLQSYLIYIVGSNIYGRITTGGGTASTDISTSLSLNTWTHIVLTYDGSNMVLYKNGVSAASSAKTGTMSNTYPFLIGAQFNNVGSVISEYLAGNVSTIKLYNRALSATEVLQNYDALKRRY